jgi:hypothetical protein
MPLLTKVGSALPDPEQRLRRGGPLSEPEDYDREILPHLRPMSIVSEKVTDHMAAELLRKEDMKLLSEAAQRRAKDAMLDNQPGWFPQTQLALPAGAPSGAEAVPEMPVEEPLLALQNAEGGDQEMAEEVGSSEATEEEAMEEDDAPGGNDHGEQQGDAAHQEPGDGATPTGAKDLRPSMEED